MAKAGKKRSTFKSSRNRKAAPAATAVVIREIYSAAQATLAHYFNRTGEVQDIQAIFVGEGNLSVDTEHYPDPRATIDDLRKRFANERSICARAGKVQKNKIRERALQAAIAAELPENWKCFPVSRMTLEIIDAVDKKLRAGGHKGVSRVTVERRLRLLK